ncbi:hypothetical protein MKK84_19470 [Methylobacterium sp. E-065]|uniref:hypothetical protein n=1 Tax=Methylobacterium sp. E-065 TaxID=2836583 RepID=UPI001FBC0412|nr:hypothetical protein [Methylobacterium sp. E-065]MCJ2019586.1 hypothetical protein [Methylobacterium sp. E-065]
MKWLLDILLALGIALIAWGTAITNGPGSADERVAGSVPILAGIGFVLLDFVIAFVWLVVRA